MAAWGTYQMKPISFQAQQWKGYGSVPGVEGKEPEDNGVEIDDMPLEVAIEIGVVDTLVGRLPVYPGDWVVHHPLHGRMVIPGELFPGLVRAVDDEAKKCLRE